MSVVDSTTSDPVVIKTYLNLLTLLFNGKCLDSFSDMEKTFSITERLGDEGKDKLIIVAYMQHKEVRIAFFRMHKDDKGNWTKGSAMTFAASTMDIASQMCKTPEVLFAVPPKE